MLFSRSLALYSTHLCCVLQLQVLGQLRANDCKGWILPNRSDLLKQMAAHGRFLYLPPPLFPLLSLPPSSYPFVAEIESKTLSATIVPGLLKGTFPFPLPHFNPVFKKSPLAASPTVFIFSLNVLLPTFEAINLQSLYRQEDCCNF